MATWTTAEFDLLTGSHRSNFFNSLAGYKPIHLIATMSRKGLLNVAPFSGVFHVGSAPAILGITFRPATVERHTLDNILNTQYFTLNMVTDTFYKAAHQTGAKYPQNTSEFDAVGLEMDFKTDIFPAPFVQGAPIQIGMEFIRKIDIEENGSHIILGEPKCVTFPDNCLTPNSELHLDKAGILANSANNQYYKTTLLDTLFKPEIK